MTAWLVAELERRISNLLRIGTIEQIDTAAARVRVRSGDILTAWLPWLTQRAGQDLTWWAPDIGEQVLVLSPGGELAAGLVLPSLYQSANPAPGDNQDKQITQYKDGTKIEYDRAAGLLTVDAVGDITIKAAGSVTLEAGGPVLVKAPEVTIDTPAASFTGAVNVAGLLTFAGGMAGSGGSGGATAIISGSVDISGGDLSADGISLKDHTHQQSNNTPTGPAQ